MASAGAGVSAPGDGSSTPGPRAQGDGGRGRSRGRGGRGRGRGSDGRGRGAGRGRGHGAAPVPSDTNNPHPGSHAAPGTPKPSLGNVLTKPAPSKADPEAQEDDDTEAEICFICANPIMHRAIAPCNHVTCHICALRMRALYKNKDCPHCRTAAPFVIFTDDSEKRFEDYKDENLTSWDTNVGIKYTAEDIVGDTVLLLRYNCPDDSCDFAGNGWLDLHQHVRITHRMRMCDLCTRNKKVFTHEHELFGDKELQKHMRHGDDQPGALDQTGFRGHPLCSFCGERFYDDDKLYEHCRDKHERCFVCDRQDSRRPHYYKNYEELEKHFSKDHHLCLDNECLEKKFVVFGSAMDLKAHQVAEHADSMSKDVRRDARVVDMSSFDFRPTYVPERGARGGRGGRGGRRDEERNVRGRDPNAEPLPASSAQPLRRDELAFQRQMAIHSAQSVSTRTFGGQLTSSAPAPSPARPAAERPAEAQPPLAAATAVTDAASITPQERARLVRHGAVIERASNMLGNDATKIAKFRSDISSFRTGALTAPLLIDAFFALFTETSSNALGTLMREVADLFDDKAKAESLRGAWHDWRAINEDYPSLPGLGGMHGATTSSSGWANAAAASPTTNNTVSQKRHTIRVLKLKNSTRRGSAGGIPTSSPAPARSVPGATWTSSSQPVSRTSTPASAAFPALPGAGSANRTSTTSWIGGTGTATHQPPRNSTPAVAPPPLMRRPVAGAASNAEAFPALPAAPKPLTTIFGYGRGAVRRDVGGRDTGFQWGNEPGATGSGGDNVELDAQAGGKGKKKQGKKQVLNLWG